MDFNVYNEMFNDRHSSSKYFEEHVSEEPRKAVLKTDKLRYWYCYLIEGSPEIAEEIKEEPYKSLYNAYVALVSDAGLAPDSLLTAVQE